MTLVRGYANSMVKDYPFWVRNSQPAPEVVPNAPPIKVCTLPCLPRAEAWQLASDPPAV